MPSPIRKAILEFQTVGQYPKDISFLKVEKGYFNQKERIKKELQLLSKPALRNDKVLVCTRVGLPILSTLVFRYLALLADMSKKTSRTYSQKT